MKSKHNKGFTLIELMIVVAVLAIIVAIAYPGFLSQIQKARRSDAKQALFDVAAKLEQYYQDNKGYPTAANMDLLYPDVNATTFTSLEGYYTIGFNAAVPPTVTTYLIEAIPTGSQTGDKDCYGFYLSNLGEKTNRKLDGTTVINNDRCW
jgi:type IV pilus assembly protein PilE